MPRFAIALALSLLPLAARAAPETWLTPTGAGQLAWGTTHMPMETSPKERALYLPDAGYVGARPADRPEDLEIAGPHPEGERRFVRYVGTELVDGWLMRPGAIDTSAFSLQGAEQWKGAILGPAESGQKAVGDATSWDLGGHTALHWRDRMSDVEVLVVRAKPTGRYAVQRAAPLEPGIDSRKNIRMKGSLKTVAKPVAGYLSGCLDSAPKPVTGTVEATFDRLGRLGRVHVRSDQPALDVEQCIAAALTRAGAPPNLSGQLELFRMN